MSDSLPGLCLQSVFCLVRFSGAEVFYNDLISGFVVEPDVDLGIGCEGAGSDAIDFDDNVPFFQSSFCPLGLDPKFG